KRKVAGAFKTPWRRLGNHSIKPAFLSFVYAEYPHPEILFLGERIPGFHKKEWHEAGHQVSFYCRRDDVYGVLPLASMQIPAPCLFAVLEWLHAEFYKEQVLFQEFLLSQ